MTHLEFSTLMTDYVDGILDAALAREVEAHLGDCIPCRRVVEDVRFAMASCRGVPAAEPTPWLLARIVRATTGEHKPAVTERLVAWWHSLWRPQIAYSLSMVVFSLSFVLYAANVNLRSVRLRDVNPINWVYRANSRGHLLVARAEKYYYDLRVVYEVQSILHGLQQQPTTPGAHPKSVAPAPSSGNESFADGTDLAAQTGSAAERGLAARPGGRSQAL
ncbi:MAG: anti-sigma factor family protein [Terriglobia bacterium]